MLKNVARFDKSQLRGAEKTAQGFLKVPAAITKVGVLSYRRGDGKMVRELRLPEEVFKPESIDTLRGVPFTNLHPKALLTPETVKPYIAGHVHDDVAPEEDTYLVGSITVMDAATINDIEAGTTEVSAGYKCDLEEAPGVWNGEAYDFIQRNIRYNHVSLVPAGRAGSEVAIRMDSLDAIQDEIKGDIPMEKITINGVEYECSPELKAAIEKQMSESQANMDALQAKCDGMVPAEEKKDAEVKMDQAVARADAAEAKVKKLEKEGAARMDANEFKSAVNNRVKLVRVATDVLHMDSAEIDKLSDKEIKVKIVESHTEVKMDGKSDEYVNASFDIAMKDIEETQSRVSETKKTFHERLDGKDSEADSDAARERQRKRTLGIKDENKK